MQYVYQVPRLLTRVNDQIAKSELMLCRVLRRLCTP